MKKSLWLLLRLALGIPLAIAYCLFSLLDYIGIPTTPILYKTLQIGDWVSDLGMGE